jgi:hypothetical protein
MTMKHYKDPETGEVYGYNADGSQDAWVKPNLVPVTLAEADSLRKAWAEKMFAKLTYAEKRAAAYPDFAEYLDGIVKGDQVQIAAYIAACLAVKERFPKS